MRIFTSEIEIFIFVLIGVIASIISLFKCLIALRNKSIWWLRLPELITFCYIVFFLYIWITPTYSFGSIFNL